MRNRGWYYSCDKDTFYGFHFHIGGDDELLPEGNWWGPFETLLAANEDALGYYQCDIDTAKSVMASVRLEYKSFLADFKKSKKALQKIVKTRVPDEK